MSVLLLPLVFAGPAPVMGEALEKLAKKDSISCLVVCACAFTCCAGFGMRMYCTADLI